MFEGLGDDYLPAADNAWLRMDDRRNRMVITAVLSFDEPVSYEDVVERFEERLLNFDRFRQRVVEPWHGLRPKLEFDPLFDVENHVSHVALPEPQGEEEFQEFVGDILDDPLDDSRPMWHAWLVEGVGDSNALVVRIHHVLADGFALLYVLYGLADDPGSIELPIGSLPPLPGEEGFEEHVEAKGEAGGRGLLGGVELGSLREEIEDAVDEGRETAKAVVDTLKLSREPDTVFRGDLALSKNVSWTDSFDLDRVKLVSHALDGTVNDFLMAATAGAFRRYMFERDQVVADGLELRSAMPVNLKPLEHRDEPLGNYFGFGFVELPVGTEGIEQRVEFIQERTGMLKQGTDAYMMYRVLKTVGAMPDSVQDVASLGFRGRVTAAISNVPGPVDSLEIAGSEVEDLMFWVPTSEDIGVGVSILSYDGDVRVGVATDERLVPDPEALAEAFEEEVEAAYEQYV
ncbi:MAG: wax ester/triacylglycerol synthase family O-acyltransferase [Halobacteriales archaeon]